MIKDQMLKMLNKSNPFRYKANAIKKGKSAAL